MSHLKGNDGFAFSRRSFIKSFGTTAAVAATAQVEAVAAELQKVTSEKLHGPGPVPITLQVNGQLMKLEAEPRVTLLEALRTQSQEHERERVLAWLAERIERTVRESDPDLRLGIQYTDEQGTPVTSATIFGVYRA